MSTWENKEIQSFHRKSSAFLCDTNFFFIMSNDQISEKEQVAKVIIV